MPYKQLVDFGALQHMCIEYYGSIPYTQQQWEQSTCPLGTLAPNGCFPEPVGSFSGVCRIEGTMNGEWMVALHYIHGLSIPEARETCEDESEMVIGFPGSITRAMFFPPWN
ncbi:MAG: hypothetical protein AAGF11_52395 [Myxococcota bacterium]